MTGYDDKGSTKGRDYVFLETFGKTYEDFINSLAPSESETVVKSMKDSTSPEDSEELQSL